MLTAMSRVSRMTAERARGEKQAGLDCLVVGTGERDEVVIRSWRAWNVAMGLCLVEAGNPRTED